MADFHFSVTQIKRSAGQSAVAAAAYRAGEKLFSEIYGEYSDYTRKRGIVETGILLPPFAPINNQKQAIEFLKMLNDSILRSELTETEYDSSIKTELPPLY